MSVSPSNAASSLTYRVLPLQLKHNSCSCQRSFSFSFAWTSVVFTSICLAFPARLSRSVFLVTLVEICFVYVGECIHFSQADLSHTRASMSHVRSHRGSRLMRNLEVHVREKWCGHPNSSPSATTSLRGRWPTLFATSVTRRLTDDFQQRWSRCIAVQYAGFMAGKVRLHLSFISRFHFTSVRPLIIVIKLAIGLCRTLRQ